MKRNAYAPDEKAKMALEALRGEGAVNEIASARNIRSNTLSRWKREAESNLHALFQDGAAKKRKEEKAHEEELQSLYAKIGQLTAQNERLKKKPACEMSVPERKALIETDGAELPVSTQAELLELNPMPFT